MLTARGDEADRVLGLELGADDYVVKPFSARELVARIRAVLRRTSAAATPAATGPQQIGAIELDPSARTVTLDGEPLELTRKEFDLLALLMGQAGTVVSRERLIDEVWDVNWFGSTKTLDVHVSGLRKKLGDDSSDPRYLHTVRGVGFRFAQLRGARGAMSLRLRLVLAFGYVLLFAIIALEVPLTLNFSRRVDSEIKAEASAGAQAVAAAASGRLTNPTRAGRPRPRAGPAPGRPGDRRRRRAAACSWTPTARAARGTPYASRPEIAQALRGATSQGTRHSDSLDADLLYTAVPIVDAGRAAGAVRLTQSVKAVNDEVRRDVVALLALGAAVLALGLGLAWAIAGSLSRPLRGLARTARQIAAGDLHTRATPTGSAEQVEVANAFNDMTDRLVRALDAQRDFVANASHQLRTPLTGLRLRLESASLRAEDPDLKRDLVAGELETERLAKLLSNLLRLAQDGQPATTRDLDRPRRRGRARRRPLARPGRARRPRRSSSPARARRTCAPRPATSTPWSTTSWRTP